MKTFSNALQTWNIWALNMSRVHPINTWLSSCPRLDKSIGLFGFNAENNFFKTPINLSACFLINNNNNDNNNNIFICTAKFDKVFKYALLALINRAGGLYGRILTEVTSTDRTLWGLYQRPRSRFSHTDRPSSVNKVFIIWPNKKANEQKHN